MFDRHEIKVAVAENLNALFSLSTALVWCLSVLIATVAGPFGTFEAMGLIERTLFWGVIASLSIGIGYAMRALAMVSVGHHRPALFDLVATLGMTLVFSPVLWVVSSLFSRVSGVWMPGFGRMTLYVLVVAFGAYVLRRLVPGIEPTTYSFLMHEAGAVPDSQDMTQPRLLRRLSSDMRAPVLRLSARGHFVNVVTETGEEALRLRLADAINETDPIDGVQPHRSHWVARAAISGVERDGKQRIFLTLRNGDRVPVSRGYRARLEAEGVI